MTSVKQLRTVLNTGDDEFEESVRFYRDVLGLTELASFSAPGGAHVVILDAGRATLELANPAQSAFIAEVETGGVPSTPVRLAFEVDDAEGVSSALAAHAELVAAPVHTPWDSLNARLVGPGGLHVTVFSESGGVERSGVVGTSVDELGGEAGLLARAVELAAENSRAGAQPFGALAVRDGVVVGAGVNEAGADPTAHAEVQAVRDAGRRLGQDAVAAGALAEVTVYSSCEPCALCRLAAITAGVREIVFAVPAAAVPDSLAGERLRAAGLAQAVSGMVPGLVRRGEGFDQGAALAVFDAWR